VGAATPYFIAASALLMLAWTLWLFRQTGYRPKPFARSLVRHGVVMGSIYGVTLAATIGVAHIAGVSM
jgi:cytosine/uracil/thiamine/allantoin permease